MSLVRAQVESPTPPARRYGLYSVADVKAFGNPHEMQGIEFEAQNCSWGVTLDTAGVCVATTRAPNGADQSQINGDPFAVYAYEQCAGVNEFRDATNKAIRRLNYGEERGVEDRLQAILSGTAATNLTGGTVYDLKKSLAILEDWADANYAGQATILTSRAAGSLLGTQQAVSIHGLKRETELGNVVASSTYLGDLGPSNAAPAAGETWLWATGVVEVRRSVAEAHDPYFVQSAGVNEVQTVSITGTPTGGTYTLTFDGQTTTAIAYNANNTTIQNALVALSNVDAGDITVTGTYPNFTLTFGGQYQTENVPQVTATPSLTGGTAPTVAVATTTPGQNNFGDNTWRALAQKMVVVTYDCFSAAIKATLV